MAEFKLPPVSPMAGTTVANYFRVFRGNSVLIKYWPKVIITFVVVLFATPFHWYEWMRYHKKIRNFRFKAPPVFILGHWRSGTTYLHNLMCQDPGAAFITTYHALWPHNLASKLIFKTFMSILMPKKRPSDNVELAVHYPQEDEFTIGNIIPHFHYKFWYFPRRWRECYDKYIRFNLLSDKQKKQWDDAYYQMVAKAMLNTGGSHAVIKNPSNTARVHRLLKIFPDARFIHIHRNPVIVYLSTKKFFIELYPTLTYQKIEEDEIVEMVFENFENVMKEFLEQRKMISPENFMELGFEAFESDPMHHLKKIYDKLGIPDFDKTRTFLQTYVDSMQSYQKNKYYTIQKWELDRILDKWDFAMKEWGYHVPDNLKIIE